MRNSKLEDERYMRLAIALAKKAEGMTNPNPIVGAVVVKDGSVVGKGWHRKAGLPHAEVNALRESGDKAEGSTLYVTLEPCCHFGRTPPCTDMIIKSGVKRIVCAMKDPNPLNNGKGTSLLKRHGIITDVAMLEDTAKAINRPYIKYIAKGIPYVTIKAAQSIDGKIATRRGDSRWISSDLSRRYVHSLRGKVDAVMVGVNTILKDDPLLTARQHGAKQPLRIIVDSHLRTPLNARIFADIDRSPAMIVAARPSKKAKAYEARGAEVVIAKSKGGMVDLRSFLKYLAKRGIMHILVEGGGKLNASLIEEGLADRLLVFIAPKIIGGEDAVTSFEGRGAATVKEAVRLKDIKWKRLGSDMLVEGET